MTILETEQALLGSVLLDGRIIDEIAFLAPENFLLPAHMEIFRAMQCLRDRDMPIDLTTICTRLDGVNFGALSVDGYVAGLVSQTATSVHASAYAVLVAKASLLRRLGDVGMAITALAKGEDADAALEEAERLIYEVRAEERLSAQVSMSQLMLFMQDLLIERREVGSDIVGVASGFAPLDRITHGFRGNQLITLAAQTGMGKTALALNFLHNMARHGVHCALFSLEMGREEVGNRLISLESFVDSDALTTGMMDDDAWGRTVRALGQIADYPIVADFSETLSLTELRSKARRMKQTSDIQFLAVDYLGLMDFDSGHAVEELGRLSRGLKRLAKELDICVLLLAQLNRNPMGRADHRPQLEDLRGSGSIGHDSNLVLMLHREGQLDPECETPNLAELFIRKNRGGALGDVPLVWNGSQVRFLPVQHVS